MNAFTYVYPERLRQLTCDIFSSFGLSEQDARIVSDHLVKANLRGVDSHGVNRVGVYVERLKAGLVDKVVRINTVRETPVSALVDGGNGPGIVVAARSMETAMEKAEQTGVGMVSVRHSNHCGMLSFYAQRAVERGLIAMLTTSAPPTMAPWGSKSRFFGTNPFCYGLPAGDGGIDVVFDMATSNVALGKIIMAAKNGQEIPLGWAMDSDGRQTTNPKEALDGLMLPVGGPKGSGIAFFVEVLSSILSGANFGPHIPPLYNNPDHKQNLGHFFFAVKPDLFVSREEFYGRMSEMIQELRKLPAAEGYDRVYVPGELEVETEQRRLAQGIPLSYEILRELEDIAEGQGLSFDLRAS